MRIKRSVVAPIVVVIDGNRRGYDQQLTEFFARRHANRRCFGHRGARGRADSRETRSVHAGYCTVPIVTVIVVAAIIVASATVAVNIATVSNAVVSVAVAVAATAGAGKDDIVVLTDVADCGDCPSSCWLLGAGAVVRFNDLVGDEIFRIGLFTPIHDIFRKMQPASRGPSNDGVMSWWCVSHFHCTKLQERFP